MELALALGRRGRGLTWPNPAVGAVIVRDGVIVGRGWTQKGGRPHAEVEALRRAGAAARGATLYVTLEPCSHHGRSPPCADAVIAAGITRVVSAIEDANPDVAGRGHERIRSAGIEVAVGLCGGEAAHDHDGHFRRFRNKRPHVVLKLAVSADDRIGGRGRSAVAITGFGGRQRVHLLRAQSDAILVGIGTVLADDPLLTCRLPGMEERSPIPVVLDRHLRLPRSCQLLSMLPARPLWLVGAAAPDRNAPDDFAVCDRAAALAAQGAEILTPERADLAAVLRLLAEKGITRLMVEGGARVASSFVAAGLVDEFWLFRGSVTIGSDGVDALEGLPLSALTQASEFSVLHRETLGRDSLTIYGRA